MEWPAHLLLVRGEGVSNLIALGTKCEYRHVFIIIVHKKRTKIYFFIN